MIPTAQQPCRINEMTSRQAMGLSDCFSSTPLDDLSTQVEALRSASTERLVELAEDPGALLAARLVAGTILALTGDPRIETERPHMVRVPAGRAVLGLAPERVDQIVAAYAHRGVLYEWIEKECPEYAVDIKAFAIGRYCVTNQEYRDFLLDSGYPALPTSWTFGIFPVERSNHPVHSLAPEDADAYCAWLSGRTRRRFRLPTEAEWEYVASNGLGTEFPWGDKFETGRANTAEEGLFRSSPVGIFPRGSNQLGVCDLAGNVEEYTATDYAPYPGGACVNDDLLTHQGPYRVARGGSFTRFADLARTRRRHGRYDKDIYVMGFRLAEDDPG